MRRIINEFTSMVSAYHRKHYPSFIYERTIAETLPPVFYYHKVRDFEFENQLMYLKENGYEPVCCDEYLDAVVGKRRYDARKPVMLTFDDGLRSLYSEVFPLIAKYNTRIVAYIAPAWIGKSGFLTWDQCREMHRTGLVDFQSHSLTHSSVVTNLRVLELRQRKSIDMAWDIPGMSPDNFRQDFHLVPVFHGSSLFEGKSAFEISDLVWKELLECEKVYGSGRISTKNPLRSGYLLRQYNKLLEKHIDQVRRRNCDEIYEEIIFELRESKNAIESNLPGQRVKHFAFPWSKSSSIAWRALEEEGYKSGAVGLNVTNERARTSLEGIRVYRVNGDFTYCLPGHKRVSFSVIIGKKIQRRIKSGVRSTLSHEYEP